jgi:hypothetical protein
MRLFLSSEVRGYLILSLTIPRPSTSRLPQLAQLMGGRRVGDENAHSQHRHASVHNAH